MGSRSIEAQHEGCWPATFVALVITVPQLLTVPSVKNARRSRMPLLRRRVAAERLATNPFIARVAAQRFTFEHSTTAISVAMLSSLELKTALAQYLFGADGGFSAPFVPVSKGALLPRRIRSVAHAYTV